MGLVVDLYKASSEESVSKKSNRSLNLLWNSRAYIPKKKKREREAKKE